MMQLLEAALAVVLVAYVVIVFLPLLVSAARAVTFAVLAVPSLAFLIWKLDYRGLVAVIGLAAVAGFVIDALRELAAHPKRKRTAAGSRVALSPTTARGAKTQ